MKISILAIVALVSASSFVQCMEKSYKDIAEAIKTLQEIKIKESPANEYSLAIKDLCSIIKQKSKENSNETTNLQKLQSEVASIKQTQNDIVQKIDKLHHDVA